MITAEENNTMTIENKPDYLYNPDLCPCPRGEKANCPRYKNCDACIENHHSNPNSPLTACEKKYAAEQEQ